MMLDSKRPGRYLAVTGEGKAYWFDFPNPGHESFVVEGERVYLIDPSAPDGKTWIDAAWYYLNEVSLYHTLLGVLPKELVDGAEVKECMCFRFMKEEKS